MRFFVIGLAAMAFFGLQSCCKGGTCAEVEAAAVDCAKDAAGGAVDSVMPAVLAILTQGGDNWMSLLTALEVPAAGAVVCAVQKAVTVLQSPAAAKRVEMAPLALKGAGRARVYLAKHGIKVGQ